MMWSRHATRHFFAFPESAICFYFFSSNMQNESSATTDSRLDPDRVIGSAIVGQNEWSCFCSSIGRFRPLQLVSNFFRIISRLSLNRNDKRWTENLESLTWRFCCVSSSFRCWTFTTNVLFIALIALLSCFLTFYFYAKIDELCCFW